MRVILGGALSPAIEWVRELYMYGHIEKGPHIHTLYHVTCVTHVVSKFCENGIITNTRVLRITIRTLLCRYTRGYTHLLIIRLFLCLNLIHAFSIVLLTSRYV